jgi:LysM repeat protein
LRAACESLQCEHWWWAPELTGDHRANRTQDGGGVCRRRIPLPADLWRGLAGAVGLLALIIFAAGALGGGGDSAATTDTAESTAPAIDFAATTPADGTVAAATPTTPTTVTATAAETTAAAQTTTAAIDGAAAAPPATTVAPPAQASPIVLETPTAPDPAPARPLEAPSTLPTAENSVVHEVVAGDTLYDLAIYYGSSIEAIMDANGLSENEFIMVGDRLIIPAVENSGSDE